MGGIKLTYILVPDLQSVTCSLKRQFIRPFRFYHNSTAVVGESHHTAEAQQSLYSRIVAFPSVLLPAVSRPNAVTHVNSSKLHRFRVSAPVARKEHKNHAVVPHLIM